MFGLLFFPTRVVLRYFSSLGKHCVFQFVDVPIDYKKLRRNQSNKLRQAKHRAEKKAENAVKSEVELLIADILSYGKVYPCNFLTWVSRVY